MIGEPVDELLTAFADAHRAANGVPDDALAADRERARCLIESLAGGEIGVSPLGISPLGISPLGVAWTETFDVPSAVGAERLRAAGWLPLDPLVSSRPRKGHGQACRWAVVDSGRVLAGVRLVDRPVDPVRAVLDRCRERSEVRLAEVLELRELRRQGRTFPQQSAELRAAAEIESALGGRLLAPWASGRSATAPVRLAGGRRRVVIAISGVDGAGKSTLREALADSLGRAGLPVSTVWVRPGMGLGRLTALAAWAKRLLRQDAAPGLRAMAEPDVARPASRRGAVGWLWAMLVTLSFLAGVWRQHRAARGVVLYDRHLVDALATLDFAYAGVDLRLAHRLVRALLPRADVRLYLDVPAGLAVARKPDDLLGEHAVRRQLTAYARWLDRLPPTMRLDGTQPSEALVGRALGLLTGGKPTTVRLFDPT